MRSFKSVLGMSLALVGFAAPAFADISNVVFYAQAVTEDGHSATWSVTQDQGTWNGDVFTIQVNGTVEMRDPSDNTLVATINPSQLPVVTGSVVANDPQVNLNFAVQAGASNTNFLIGSALVSFATLTNPDAVASASISVTDAAGGGVTLNKAVGWNGAYLAQYNGMAWSRSGSTYAEVIPSVAAGAFQTNSSAVNVPNSGTQTIPGAVSSISSAVAFTLTPFDLASGTTTFTVTPEPASLALLALGGLLIRRR